MLLKKQDVALPVRNTTGPTCSRGTIIRLEAAWCHRLVCAGEAACRLAMECYRPRRRWWRQTPATVTSLAPYTMCGRASNNNWVNNCYWQILCIAAVYHPLNVFWKDAFNASVKNRLGNTTIKKCLETVTNTVL